MTKNIVLILIILLFFCQLMYAKESPHNFKFLGSSFSKSYCSFCHKLRKSYEIKPVWGKPKSYKYITPNLYENRKQTAIEVKRLYDEISAVCISCHTDYIEHSKSFHPINVDIRSSLNKIKNIRINNKKVNNKLPLYKNGFLMACPTCHDPHTKEVRLLRDTPSRICLDCHDR
ncbi:hypothetical protein FHQ18_02970 [Deferribacter autotrophicus]|uniref:Doubled CXXCH motif domain-containing protein n=2 Tax=Deferribacter autotrophicus TaxID=500465 RepID=A0A5A8F455_9BACT|nr:hypothetical protein FHQ18_02970 [Deferribacter autotrophicus]